MSGSHVHLGRIVGRVALPPPWRPGRWPSCRPPSSSHPHRPVRRSTCGMSLGVPQVEGAAGSLVFDAPTIPAVAGQVCNATVSLTGTIATAGGTRPSNVAGNGQAHTLTVSFLPGQPPPDILWQWSPHCADPGTLRTGSSSRAQRRAPPPRPHSTQAEVRVCPAASSGTIPGSTLLPPEVEFPNPRASSGWHRRPATSATGWSPGVVRPRPSATPPG